MALTKDITLNIISTQSVAAGFRLKETSEPVVFPAAYHRIVGVSVGKLTQTARVVVLDKPEGLQLLAKDYFDLPVDLLGGNSVAQAYAALKQLPEFADAIDA